MNTIPEALEALKKGLPVLVLDDESRENEGDAILAGENITAEQMGWMIRHGSGYVCAPMTDEIADRLQLPMMVTNSQDRLRTAYTITCDAAQGTTTGISAHDRALTVRLLADPNSKASDFNRPGHMVPLRARPGGVLTRPGHTEACVDLCRLAGLAPVGAIAELVHDDGSMMRTPDVIALGEKEKLPVITIAELIKYRTVCDRVQQTSKTTLPTPYGEFEMLGFHDQKTNAEHLVLISPKGSEKTGSDPKKYSPLVRIHSECLTGDVFSSQRCDCGEQLRLSLAKIAEDGGVLIYLKDHEGRGVGLKAKLAAYELQDSGYDTVDAQTQLGLPIDAREYGAAAGILAKLGINEIRLLTNNPDKIKAQKEAGINVVETIALITQPTAANHKYLATKKARLGHLL